MRYPVICFAIFWFQTLIGQGFRSRHFDPGSLDNAAKAIFETPANNFIAGGFAGDNISNHLCIMGLNSQGQFLWIKKYGNIKFEYLENPFTARSFYKQGNNVYFVGCARDSNNRYNGVLIKFNMSGDTIWQKIYRDPDPFEDVVPQMVTGSVDGGFLITGFFQNNGSAPYSKCLLIKTDANGNELWRKKINKVAPNVHDGKAIVQDSLSKKIVIAGYQYIGNSSSWGNYDNIIILDSLGIKLSQLQYTNSNGSVLFDLIQTRDKKFVAVGKIGQSQMIGAIETDKSFAVKFDLDNPGTPIWTLSFDMYSQDHLFSCVNEFSNGDLLFSGHIDTMLRHNLNENLRIRLTRLDKDGNLLWNKYYDYSKANTNVPFYESIASTFIGSNNSILAAIHLFNFPSPNPFFFVKFDSTGCDSTLAYCQSQVASGVYQNALNDVSVEVFPNPASDRFTMKVNNNAAEKGIELHVFDLSGREIKRIPLANEKEVVDISDLSKGAYILRLTQNGQLIYTSKLVK